MQLPVINTTYQRGSDDRAKELVAIYDYEILYLKSRFLSDLKSINALNYLQVPSIDWSDSGYIQHFINVIEKMPTTNK